MLACLFVSFTAFTACSDDDKQSENSLVGVWEEIEYDDDEPYVFTFKADQTGSCYDPRDGYSSDFEWFVDGYMLYWTWSSNDDWCFRLDGDTLYLYYQLSDYQENSPEFVLRRQR